MDFLVEAEAYIRRTDWPLSKGRGWGDWMTGGEGISQSTYTLTHRHRKQCDDRQRERG